MLCAMCIVVLQSDEESHHKSLSDLQRASEYGCRICSFLIEELCRKQYLPNHALMAPRFFPLRIKRWHFGIQFFWGRRGENKTTVYLVAASEFLQNDLDSLSAKFRTSVTQAKDDMEAEEPWRVRNGSHAPLSGPLNTGHADVLNPAKKWLNTCVHEHTQCQRGSNLSDSWYPKRLIELGVGGNARLIDTNNQKQDGFYATLSHCWGSSEFFHLTEDNIADLQQQIPVEKLPKSFQDTIKVCRQFDIKYLWIDSLCIIQRGKSSRQDWLEQAEAMAQIYQNCLLNISIDHASNPHVGAFVQEGEGFRRSGGNSYAIYSHSMQPHGEVCLVVTYPFLMRDLANGPLSKRAWVLQERILSPRTLHFGADRVIWECETVVFNELRPRNFWTINSQEGSLTPFTIPNPSTFFTRNPGNKEDVLDYWRITLVPEYTNRQLSHPNDDKLVAISAIARQVGELLQEDYAAGLFRDSFLALLLWHCGPSAKRQIVYRAPSWSWASVDGSIRYINNDALVSTVLDVQTELVNPSDTYGQVRSGLATIKGPLTRCIWHPERDPALNIEFPDVARPSGLFVTGRAIFDDDEEMRSSGREFSALFIDDWQGLLIAKVDEQNVFQRVGIFWQSWRRAARCQEIEMEELSNEVVQII